MYWFSTLSYMQDWTEYIDALWRFPGHFRTKINLRLQDTKDMTTIDEVFRCVWGHTLIVARETFSRFLFFNFHVHFICLGWNLSCWHFSLQSQKVTIGQQKLVLLRHFLTFLKVFFNCAMCHFYCKWKCRLSLALFVHLARMFFWQCCFTFHFRLAQICRPLCLV